jgi:Flp pilus assembly protein TadG
MRNITEYKKDEDGVAAVEFALIVPILAMLMIGLMDFGLFINAEMKLENMARSAADYVANGGDPADINAEIIANGFTPDTVNTFDDVIVTTASTCECDDGVEVDCTGSCDAGTGYMREFFAVDLEIEYTTVFPYPGLPDSVTLVGHARMQVR